MLLSTTAYICLGLGTATYHTSLRLMEDAGQPRDQKLTEPEAW